MIAYGKPKNNFNSNSSKEDRIKNKLSALSQFANNSVEKQHGTIYETFNNSLYQQLNFYQYHTLNHFFTTITLDHISQL